MKKIKYFCLVLLVGVLFGQKVSATDYQKINIKSSKEVCISYAAWGPAKQQGIFSSCSNDYNLADKKVYKEGSNCSPSSEVDPNNLVNASAQKLKCTTNPGAYCVPQMFITLYGDTPEKGLYIDEACTQLKPGEVVTKDYCCDCTSKGGNKETISVDFKELPKCECILKEGVCEGVKDLSEIQFAAKKILNPVGFVTGQKGAVQLLGRAIAFFMFPIGGFAMMMYVWAGFLWMSAEADNITKAKSILVWTTLGVVFSLGSYIMVKFIFTSLFG